MDPALDEQSGVGSLQHEDKAEKATNREHAVYCNISIALRVVEVDLVAFRCWKSYLNTVYDEHGDGRVATVSWVDSITEGEK
ncbi:hypothetical protein BHE90_017115 [Fusarium euwallaceae]|uniref:Uncharacterized protein n=2 Tax=Fusarium solani species complex TaxID=232080 RepID=A0A428RLG3_9HYPO|nr:hypothetical protein CEP52_017637 [Fusarium oligoseptatum]RTE68506.1 hypothetical protein BHE90_017115 [Fusarium euwallaceae]